MPPPLPAGSTAPAPRQPGRYVGRFAPSPTGPLHAGSLVAALASWLDARAHGGRWLLRIEDVDTPRCVPGADREILRQLAALGLEPDAPPQWQSRRGGHYEAALARLVACGRAYPCACTRLQVAAACAALGQAPVRHGERVYPGTCRPEQGGLHGQPARAWRLRLPDAAHVAWHDRRNGAQQQDVAAMVGDFVLKRADGLWAYQLAVVVDDAEQQVSDVVRGDDLADNTPRQILLQRALGLPTPRYLHTPLLCSADGAKLSKQHGAPALDVADALAALRSAALPLGLDVAGTTRADWLAAAVAAWRGRHVVAPRA
jgi:glutamyl-Q tRNA(Asp) synthetase